MAHIQRKQTAHGLRYEVRWRDDANRHRQRSFRTSKEARAFKSLQEADQLRGEVKDHKAGRRTLRVYAAQWLRDVEVRDRTREGYRALLDAHVLPALGDRRIGGIEPDDCRQFVHALKQRGLAPATIRHAHSVLRRVLQLAVEDRALRWNPAVGLRLPNNASLGREKFEPYVLSDAEIGRLVEVMRAIHPTYALLVTLAASTGLRAGEIAGLNVADVDLLRKELRVRRSRRKVKGGWFEGEVKSDRSRRVLRLPQWLADDLRDYIAAHPLPLGQDSPLFPGRHIGGYTHGKAMPDSPRPGDWVWESPWERDTFVKHYFKPALRRAGLPESVRFHDLRHSFATNLLRKGVPIENVSRILGHSSIHITDQIYSHITGRDLGDVMNLVTRPSADSNVVPLAAPTRPRDAIAYR